MITYEEISKSILALRESQAQTDEQMKRTDKKIEATSEQMKETDKKIEANGEQLKRTEKLVKALTQNISGVNKSIGLEAEEFFYSSLKKNPTVANIKFDYIYQNDRSNLKGEMQEIDILLENGSSIGIVEVKNRVSQNSIDQLDNIMERFDYFHPIYKEYKVIGALAGKIFPKHLQEQTLKKGYSVITQQGDHIEQINP